MGVGRAEKLKNKSNCSDCHLGHLGAPPSSSSFPEVLQEHLRLQLNFPWPGGAQDSPSRLCPGWAAEARGGRQAGRQAEKHKSKPPTAPLIPAPSPRHRCACAPLGGLERTSPADGEEPS